MLVFLLRYFLPLFCCVALLPGVVSASELKTQEKKLLLGWVERAVIFPGNFPLNAKLDTGADNSSLHAEEIEKFTQGDKEFVRFALYNRHGDRHDLTLPVIRNTKIKLKQGGAQKRPVVRLGLCLGSLYREVDFNLVDRSHFFYPMLIGRSFLSGNINVDSSKTYSVEPSCDVPSE